MAEKENKFSLSSDNPVEKRITVSTEFSTLDPPTKVYNTRWMVLLVNILTQMGNVLSFIGYSPVQNIVDSYYGAGTNNRLGLIFFGVQIPVCVVCIWLTAKVGQRWLILLCAAMTTLGNGLRGVSIIDGPSMDIKRWILYIGHGTAGAGGPITLFIPTIVSSTWFPPSQRAMATSVMSIASPFGILLVNLIIPRIIKTKADLVELNIIAFIIPAASLIIGLITIRRSSPPLPPSLSAAAPTLPIMEGLVKCVKNPPYIVLVFCVGAGNALFNGFFIIMEKLLCTHGYDNAFSGLVTALMLVGGLIGATIAGLFVDRTKLFVETLKVSLPLFCFCGIGFSIAAHYPNIELIIIATMVMFGFFGLAFNGIGLEMSAECTYPVGGTTSAGLLCSVGKVQSFIFLLVFDWLTRPATSSELAIQVCTTDLKEADDLRDYNYTLIAIGVIGTVFVLIFVPFFKPEYKRMKIERHKADQENSSSFSRL